MDDSDAAKAKRKEIEESLRNKKALEDKAFNIAADLADRTVTEQTLCDVGQHITPEIYDDIIEERAIVKLCGYPVCSKQLGNIPKQKYCISYKEKVVYDVSIRKNFCSDYCFSASRHFRSQISSTPLWLRHKERLIKFSLLGRKEKFTRGEMICSAARADEELLEEISLLEKMDSLSIGNNSKSVPVKKAKPTSLDCSNMSDGESSSDADSTSSYRDAREPSRDDRNVFESTSNISVVSDKEKVSRNSSELASQKQSNISKSAEMQSDTRLKPEKSSNSENESREYSDLKPMSDARSSCADNSRCKLSEVSASAMEIVVPVVSDSVVDPSVKATANNPQVKCTEATDNKQTSSGYHEGTLSGNSHKSSRSEDEVARNCIRDEVTENSSRVQGIMTQNSNAGKGLVAENSSRSKEILAGNSGKGKETTAGNSDKGKEVIDGDSGKGKIITAGTSGRSKEIIAANSSRSKELVAGNSDKSKGATTENSSKGKGIVKENTGKGLTGTTISNDSAEKQISELSTLRSRGRFGKLIDYSDISPIPLSSERKTKEMQYGKRSAAQNSRNKIPNDNSMKKSTAKDLIQNQAASDDRKELIQIDTSSEDFCEEKSANITAPVSIVQESSDQKPKADNNMTKLCSSINVLHELSDKKCEAKKNLSNECLTSSKECVDSSEKDTQNQSVNSIQNQPINSNSSGIDRLRGVLAEWVTVDTVKLLCSKSASVNDSVDNASSSNNESKSLSNNHTGEVVSSANSSIIDSRNTIKQRLSQSLVMGDIPFEAAVATKSIPSMKQLNKDSSLYELKVKEFYGVTPDKHEASKSVEERILLPPVDNNSQLTIRRRIVLDKINRVLSDILCNTSLLLADVRYDLRLLVDSFALSSTNILLKPHEWILMTTVLLNMLSVKNDGIRSAIRDERFSTHVHSRCPNTTLTDISIALTDLANTVLNSANTLSS